MTRLTRSLGVLAATLALTGCASLRDPVIQFVNDSATTTEIKTRLAVDAPGTVAPGTPSAAATAAGSAAVGAEAGASRPSSSAGPRPSL